MKKHLLILCSMLCVALNSWGYANGDVITARSATTKVMDASGNVTTAEVSSDEVGNFQFQIVSESAKTVRLYKYTGTQTTVVVPAEFIVSGGSDTYYVTHTGGNADNVPIISSCITDITYSEGLTNWETMAFQKLSAVQVVHFPSTLKNHLGGVGYYSRNVRAMYIASGNTKFWNPDGDASMVITSTDNGYDKSLVWASGWEEKNGAYEYKTELTVPEGVDYIHTYALCAMFYVVTLNIPSTVKVIETGSNFRSFTTAWTTINVDANNPYLMSEDGVAYSKDGKELICVPTHHVVNNTKDNPYKIKEGVEKINDNACSCCKFCYVELPSSVTTIGASFISSSLIEITLGVNVSSIKDACFTSCGQLIAINVAEPDAGGNYNSYYSSLDGVLYTDNGDTQYYTLVACPAAKTNTTDTNGDVVPFKIHDNCKEIAAEAFGSSKLTQVDLNNVESIGYYAFRYSKLTSIDTKNVTKTNGGAFIWCYDLKTAYINSNLNALSFNDFYLCTSLESITFADGNQLPSAIGTHCFFNCTKLTEFNVPASVTSVGTQFIQNSGVKKVTFPDNSKLKTLADKCFTDCSALEEIHFGTGMTDFTTIGEGCFRDITSLKKINIPETVTSIGTSALNGCTNLEDISFNDGSALVTLGDNVFQDCDKLTEIDLMKCESLTTIGQECFRQCDGLTEVNIPKNVNSIGLRAFCECGSLTEINVDPDNASYATTDGMLASKNKEKLIAFPGGKARDTFTLRSPSFTTIEPYAFYFCSKLKNIVIPKKVTSIGNYAFQFCENLNSITFLGDTPVSITPEEETDPSVGDNDRDHRFGNAHYTNEASGLYSAADFLKKFVTINVRKNGHEAEYKADGCYWNDTKGITYSFNTTGSATGYKTEGNAYEYLAMSDNTVGVLKSTSTNYTAVVPATVHHPDLNKDVSVGMIADYAFEDIPSSVKEMVFLGPIEYVGSNAFNDGHLSTYKATPSSNIESIFFADYKNTGANELSTARFELGTAYGTEEFPEFTSTQKIYVAKSKETDYKRSWTNFADQISYKIPLPAISDGGLSSLSREFDVDLCDDNNWDETNSRPQVAAFVGFVDKIDEYGIHMRSITCASKKTSTTKGDGDGTFIPANTGVVLKAYDGSTTAYDGTDGMYYRIGEKDNDYSGKTFETTPENVIKYVTENSETVAATDGDYTNYYFATDGTYKKFSSSITMPLHKAYMSVKTSEGIDNVTSGAKNVYLIWDDEDATTGIKNIDAATDADNASCYNLNGQRVAAGTKGLVIMNGKKCINK